MFSKHSSTSRLGCRDSLKGLPLVQTVAPLEALLRHQQFRTLQKLHSRVPQYTINIGNQSFFSLENYETLTYSLLQKMHLFAFYPLLTTQPFNEVI